MPTRHPCGSLPVDGHHISAWWCEHHQCWWVTLSIVRQAAEEPVSLRREEHQFGPFDGIAEVRHVIDRWMDLYLRSPGSVLTPGDRPPAA